MAEYSKEKLFFLKLPKDFFDKYYVKIIEGMPNGKDYLIMLLKLMCESISHGGYLRFSEEVAYTPEMIASVTGTNIDIVRSGLNVFKDLHLMTNTPTGTMYFPIVEDMTAKPITIGAWKKYLSRQGGQKGDICPPDIRDKSLDSISLEIKQDLTRYKQPALLQILLDFGFLTEDELTDSQFDDFLDACVSEYGLVNVKIKEKYVLQTISHLKETGKTDKSEKPIFRWRCDHEEMPENRFRWFTAAMSNNLRKEESDDGALDKWGKDDG